MQGDLFDRARAWRDAHTHDVASLAQAIEAAQDGFARAALGARRTERRGAAEAEAVTVRCLQRADGSIPTSDLEEDLVCLVAKSY